MSQVENVILKAIPGDTYGKKLVWVNAMVDRLDTELTEALRLAPSPCACSCGGNCDSGADAAAKAAVKALGEIEAVLLEDVKVSDAAYVVYKIAEIVDGVE